MADMLCIASKINPFLILISFQQRILKSITPETATEIPFGDIRMNAV